MRARSTRATAPTAVLPVLLALLVAVLATAAPRAAVAEPGSPAPRSTPSQAQVDAAAGAAAQAAGDVASVQAALAVADQRAEQAGVAAAQAAENYNGARYAAEQAAAAATAAQAAADQAHGSVDQQRQAYADTITDTYTRSPALGALSALASADGITDVLETTASIRNAQDALDQKYDDFLASATIADASRSAAQRSLEAATAAADTARAARDDAKAAAAAAAAQTAAYAAQRAALIGRLAQLQHISRALAVDRQRGLEVAASRAAGQAAAKDAQQAAAEGRTPPLTDSGGAAYGDDLSVPAYVPIPALPVGPPPKPGKGAAFAIAFARAQIGEPYVWAAAGPDAWDCSGLVMGAWANGGKALPHYSVAQYAQSTPISPADLQPGDLVFWGRSNDPATIYHVALYSGNGMIIQAPRSGVPVQEVSMYAWTAPNFYARP